VFKTHSPRVKLKDSLMPFENAYLSKSLSRLLDPINLVFPVGAKSVPSKDELNSVIKTMASELNVATVDTDLFVLLARNVAKTVQIYVSKCEQLITTSPEAGQLSEGLTNGQILNAEVANSLHQLSSGLNQILSSLDEAPNAAIAAIQSSIENVTQLMESTLKWLLEAVSRSLENKIARIHTEDFTSQLVIGEPSSDNEAPCSFYIKDIKGFIQRVQHDYLSLYECTELLHELLTPIAARCIVLFVRHASFIHDISEAGKLKLTGDMAQLELSLTPICKRISDLGDAYKLLKAFRQLLFQSLDEIKINSAIGDSLPYIVVLHFLCSKASHEFRPPHVIEGWTLSEYSSWLDSNTDESEVLKLFETSLNSFNEQRIKSSSHSNYLLYEVIRELMIKARAATNLGKS